MQIAIDCADLDHARIDGTRVYIKNVLDRLGALAPRSFFSLYHQTAFNPQLAPVMHANYLDRKIPFPLVWTQTKFARTLTQERPDVCWMPIQQLPFIRSQQTKFVVTIHDLAFKIFPHQFPTLDRMKLNLFADHAITHADHIIAVSHATKQDILRYYPQIPEERITVIYHGFDPALFQKRYARQEIEGVLNRYDILPIIPNSKFQTRPPMRQVHNSIRYILYVGAIQPRKNIPTLIKAFELLKQDPVFGQVRLVIAGEPAWQARPTLESIERSSARADIVRTGKVTFEDLATLYQGAAVFVMPSRYEGFGIPVLEAFVSQVPVIVADNSSLREIALDAAMQCDADDPSAWAGALQSVLQNDKLRADLIERGLRRVETFSWQRSAEQTLKVLASVVKPKQEQ